MEKEIINIINRFQAILKEVEKLQINSCSCRIGFNPPYALPYELIESKYIEPLIDGVATYSKVIGEIEEKYPEQNILKYCQHILEIIGDKAGSCKADLQQGFVYKSQYWCLSIFSTLFIELVHLMFKLIRYYEYTDEDEAFNSSNIIDEAIKENGEDKFDVSKSYKIIANNIDYIKDALIKKIEED